MPHGVISPDNWKKIKEQEKYGRFGKLTEQQKRELDTKQFQIGKQKGGPGHYEIVENGKVVGITNNMSEAEKVRHLEEAHS